MKSDGNASGRKLYNDRKLWGICPICGNSVGKDETTICCSACLAKRREWGAAHRASTKEASRRFREKHRALGLCTFCNAPAEEGRTLCTYHREYTTEMQRRKRAEKKLKVES